MIFISMNMFCNYNFLRFSIIFKQIILGIITALVLVFFATGLLIKETNYNVEVTINKPINEVFKTFTTPENSKEWIPEIKSLEVINANPGKTGSIYKIVIENQGQEGRHSGCVSCPMLRVPMQDLLQTSMRRRHRRGHAPR